MPCSGCSALCGVNPNWKKKKKRKRKKTETSSGLVLPRETEKLPAIFPIKKQGFNNLYGLQQLGGGRDYTSIKTQQAKYMHGQQYK